MADSIYIACSDLQPKFMRVKCDLLGQGPWVVNVDPTGEGFNVTHAPTGFSLSSTTRCSDAHVARRVADALNRHFKRARTLTAVLEQRWAIEAVIAATLEGDRV